MVPLVSIIIVNFNGARFLESCLEAVWQCDHVDFEVIVIDNGSTDNSCDLLRTLGSQHGNLKTIFLPENRGPSAARNYGAKAARGMYYAFLDNDTRPQIGWLSSALKTLSDDTRRGACQCKLLLADTDGIIDSVGEYLGQHGFLVQAAIAGQEHDLGQHDQVRPILAAKSAAMVVTREAFVAAGGFDEDFFIYLEDTDLCWRIWLSGFQVITAPTSVVHHHFGTTSIIIPDRINFLVKYYGCRNYVLTILKNAGPGLLLRLLPTHIMLWIGLAFYHLSRGQVESAQWILRALLWIGSHPRIVLAKRKRAQSHRRVSDEAFIPSVFRHRPFGYYLARISPARPVGNTLGWDKGI
jgi:GT2 family glycosyltransferase